MPAGATSLAPLVVHLRPAVDLDDRTFAEVCARNPELRFERTAEGDLIIMPPTGEESGRRSLGLCVAFGKWLERSGSGVGFDSSTAFRLPNGAIRSPDLSFISDERWSALTPEERDEFPPLCPDFVAEIASRTDRWENLERKMEEYRDNGARLGWLIDPYTRRVAVYEPGQPGRVLDGPVDLSADPVLPGFSLTLSEIW